MEMMARIVSFRQEFAQAVACEAYSILYA